MALIKRYSSYYQVFELKHLKKGYSIIERAVNRQGYFEIQFKHSGIKSLSAASTEINSLVRDMEINNGIVFTAHSAY